MTGSLRRDNKSTPDGEGDVVVSADTAAPAVAGEETVGASGGGGAGARARGGTVGVDGGAGAGAGGGTSPGAGASGGAGAGAGTGSGGTVGAVVGGDAVEVVINEHATGEDETIIDEPADANPTGQGTETAATSTARTLRWLPAASIRKGYGGSAVSFALAGLVTSFFVGWAFPLALIGIILGVVAVRKPEESSILGGWGIALGVLATIYSAGWLWWAATELHWFG